MVLEFIGNLLTNIMNAVPEDYRGLVNLGFYTIFIAIYAIFIWKFYKFLASREILALNLRQYNHSEHPGIEKFLAVVLFTIEYIVILPFLVLFWFTILSLFLLLLSNAETSTHQILLVSAAIIASTRITSYIGEDLAKDLAKILPFTVLATFLLNPLFFDASNLINKFSQIPSLFNNIIFFIVFIFGIEFILRGVYSIAQIFSSNEPSSEDSGNDSTNEEKSE